MRCTVKLLPRRAMLGRERMEVCNFEAKSEYQAATESAPQSLSEGQKLAGIARSNGNCGTPESTPGEHCSRASLLTGNRSGLESKPGEHCSRASLLNR